MGVELGGAPALNQQGSKASRQLSPQGQHDQATAGFASLIKLSMLLQFQLVPVILVCSLPVCIRCWMCVFALARLHFVRLRMM
jgi:hypothetical protein